MADVLISPEVGGTMWAATLAVSCYSVKKVQSNFDENEELNEKKIPLMGVMGAFVFASQMINFTIPGTGSSGHLSGGMILAALLGPYAGFITLSCILAIQALFFADGGLLSLGSNIFNMGFYTCFIAYPFIYKKIIKNKITKKKILIASILSVVIGLQLGSFSVVIQTFISGKTELPFQTFVLFMQPIHLAIGIIEGLITSAAISFIWSARPEILQPIKENTFKEKISYKKLITVLLSLSIVTGGFISYFASSNPDGLEWSIEKTEKTDVSNSNDENGKSVIHNFLANMQEKIAFLPDYGFENNSEETNLSKVNVGTSVSGIVGSLLTLSLVVLIGKAAKFYKNKYNIKEN
jgi:cobalt/nickel transport system permease protein